MTRAPVVPRLRRGQTLGRYVVVRCVGRGAMGEVYEAHDTALDRRVAVKALVCAPTDRELEESIAVREGQMLARVHHPNVVAVYDVGVADSLPFIALEFVEGQPLSTWAEADALTPAQLLRLGRELAEGLTAIHDAGLVHRDIKPANILVDNAGRARLADLGVAKLLSDIASDPAPAETTWVGTPGYWAPEVEAGEPATQASDVYSLCASIDAVMPDSPGGASGRRLAKLVQAGMAADPGARPTAQALARGLAPPARSWLPLALAAMAIAVVTVSGVSSQPPSAADDLRTQARERLRAVWTQEAVDGLRDWVDAGAQPERWQRTRIARTLEQRATAWEDAWVASGTMVSADEPSSHRACLEVALIRLSSTIEVTLAHEGSAGGLMAWIVQAPSPDGCMRSEVVRSELALPPGDAAATQLDRFRRLLAADAAVYLGQLEAAQAVLDELDEGGDLGALAGHAAYLRAVLVFRGQGSAPEAIERYREAIVVAKTFGDRVLVARATTGLSRMLGFSGRQDEALFVVRQALAELGPRPEAELPTLWLLDSRARVEAAFGSEDGQAQARTLLRDIEDRIDPESYAAALFHRASAYMWPQYAEEQWLAVWDIATVHLGPTHDFALDAWEDYLRRACVRWTAAACDEAYREFLAATQGRTVNQGEAVRLYAHALALLEAGHQTHAWEMLPKIRAALSRATQPTETIVAGLGIAELANRVVTASARERIEVSDEAIAILSALGAPAYIEGAHVLAASLAAQLSDLPRAREHLSQIAALPLPSQDDQAAAVRALARRYVEARIDLEAGDYAASIAKYDELAAQARAGETSLWFSLFEIEQALCLATVRSGNSARAVERCTAAALQPELSDEERERMGVLAALGRLATSDP